MGTTFKQVRNIHEIIKKIVTRVCKEMDAETRDCREYWQITCAVVRDRQMQELAQDLANCEALIGAYLHGLVWDCASRTGDWIDADDDDAKEAAAPATKSS